MWLTRRIQVFGMLLNRQRVVLLLCFLGVAIETATAACPNLGCVGFCANETFGCYNCPPGYRLMSPQPFKCSPCGSQCFSCTEDRNCTTCNAGNGPIDSSNCSACVPEHCAACSEDAFICQQCQSGFAFYPNDTTCGACSVHCSFGCESAGAEMCDRCDLHFGLTDKRSCEACSDHCASGCNEARAGNCDLCDHGYGFNINESCGPCSSNCSAGCNVSGQCIECDQGFGLTTNLSCAACSANCLVGCNATGAGKCDQCDQGFGINENESCGPCSPNCSVGCNSTGAGKCDSCDQGTVSVNGSCEACALNCNSSIGCNMSGAGFCDQCNIGYGWVSAETNRTCEPCSPECTDGCNITGAGKCDKCNPGYEKSETGSCTLITTVMPTTTTVAPTTATVIQTATGNTNTPVTIPTIVNYTPNEWNSNISTASVSVPDTNLGSSVSPSLDISIGSGESTTLPGGGGASTIIGSDATEDIQSEREEVILTLLLLICGGFIVSFIVTLCWCVRFFMGRKRLLVRQIKKKT